MELAITSKWTVNENGMCVENVESNVAVTCDHVLVA